MFFEIGVLKNFATFRGKQLYGGREETYYFFLFFRFLFFIFLFYFLILNFLAFLFLLFSFSNFSESFFFFHPFSFHVTSCLEMKPIENHLLQG